MDVLKNKIRLLGFLYASFLLHALFLVYLDNYAQTAEKILYCNLSPKELRIELAQNSPATEKEKTDKAHNGSKGNEKNKKLPENEPAPNFGDDFGDLRDRLEKSENLRSRFFEHFDGLLPGKEVPKSYIYRKRDYEDIIVKDVFPTLNNIDEPFSEIVKNAPVALHRHKKRNQLIEDYRAWKAGEYEARNQVEIIPEENEGEKEVLHFPKSERQKYFDQTLTLPKEEQLGQFIRKFSKYDPDKGDLPVAFRDLYYENLQRLAYVFSADQSYFTLDYYQENLNKEDYLKNALALLSEYTGSKTAAEILFTIENIYEIQQRAWHNFFQFKEAAPYLTPHLRKQIRIETLLQVMHRYSPLARAKNIHSYPDAVNLYTKKRLEIMDYGLSTIRENYRFRDMLFEKGRIYWERYRFFREKESLEKALTIWQKIPQTPSTGDFLNQETFQQLAPILQNPLALAQGAELQIQWILDRRLEKTLTAKRNREYQLLWKN